MPVLLHCVAKICISVAVACNKMTAWLRSSEFLVIQRCIVHSDMPE